MAKPLPRHRAGRDRSKLYRNHKRNRKRKPPAVDESHLLQEIALLQKHLDDS